MVQTKTYIYLVKPGCLCVSSGCTYTKIGTIQRRLAWPLRKDDTQIREAFLILKRFGVKKYFLPQKMAKKLIFFFFEAFATIGNRRVFPLKLLLQMAIEGFSRWSFPHKWQSRGSDEIVEAFPTNSNQRVFLLKLSPQMVVQGFGQSSWSFPHKWHSNGFSYAWNDT